MLRSANAVALVYLACCGISATAPAQDAFPAAGSDPTGQVVDTLDRGIAGAQVELRCDLARSGPWAQAIQQVLARTPLPKATTDREGKFVLPLTNEQRLLGSGGEGSFYLRIDKPGYRRWCERLPRGPAGYLGSRAVLDRLTDADRVAFVVAAATPGTRVQVARIWDRDPDEGELVDVPADGKVIARLPLVPNPRPPLTDLEVVPLGYRARIGSGPWQDIDRKGTSEIRVLPAAPASGAKRRTRGEPRAVKVTDKDGAPIVNARIMIHDTSCPVPPGDPFLTDRTGRAELPVGTAEVTVRAVASGFFPEERTLPALETDAAADVIVLLPAKELALRTMERGRVVPFARVELSLEKAREQSATWRFHGLASDSLGRIVVTIPRDRELRRGEPQRLPNHDSEEYDRFGRIDTDAVRGQGYAVDPCDWYLLDVPAATRIERISYWFGLQAGACRAYEVANDSASRASALLVRCNPAGAVRYLSDQGASFGLEQIDGRRARRDRQVLVVDRAAVVRRVCLRVVDQEGRPVVTARAYPTLCGPNVELGPGIGERSDEGLWIPSYDPDEHQLVVVDPGHMRKFVFVGRQPSDGPDTPIEVRLEAGAPATLRFVPARFGIAAGTETPYEVRASGSGVRVRGKIAGLPAGSLQEAFELPLREALEPGTRAVEVAIGTTTSVAQDVELVAGKMTVIELKPEK